MHTVYKKNSETPALHGDADNKNEYDMVVFCHLRWDFVYQRPQHIISRLSKTIKVLLIEEPWYRPEQAGSHLTQVNANLHVLQPNVHHIDEIAGILPQYLGKSVTTGWFYSASFLPLLNYMNYNKQSFLLNVYFKT